MPNELKPSVEPWILSALLRHISINNRNSIWVPNCGRGDIVQELYSLGADCVATDGDMSEFDAGLCDCAEMDFLDSFQSMVPVGSSLICMPPTDQMEEYVLQALAFDEVHVVAMLMPSIVKHKYPNIFQNPKAKAMSFTSEIILTTKPHLYFYSGDPKEAKKVSKLDYSWYVWMHDGLVRPPTPAMLWEGRPE